MATLSDVKQELSSLRSELHRHGHWSKGRPPAPNELDVYIGDPLDVEHGPRLREVISLAKETIARQYNEESLELRRLRAENAKLRDEVAKLRGEFSREGKPGIRREGGRIHSGELSRNATLKKKKR